MAISGLSGMQLDVTGEVFEWRGPAPHHLVLVPDEPARTGRPRIVSAGQLARELEVAAADAGASMTLEHRNAIRDRIDRLTVAGSDVADDGENLGVGRGVIAVHAHLADNARRGLRLGGAGDQQQGRDHQRTLEPLSP